MQSLKMFYVFFHHHHHQINIRFTSWPYICFFSILTKCEKKSIGIIGDAGFLFFSKRWTMISIGIWNRFFLDMCVRVCHLEILKFFFPYESKRKKSQSKTLEPGKKILALCVCVCVCEWIMGPTRYIFNSSLVVVVVQIAKIYSVFNLTLSIHTHTDIHQNCKTDINRLGKHYRKTKIHIQNDSF